MEVAIILNGPNSIAEVTESKVIYADGGYRLQTTLQKEVVALVGDFDTLVEIPINENIVRLDKEKDFTDGERAIRLAKELGYKGVVIYGALGGRIEHVLGNLALLKIAKGLGLTAVIKEKDRKITLISDRVEVKVNKGAVVSVIPYGGNCSFSKSEGLYYPLDNLTLTNGDTRGISNLAMAEKIKIQFTQGEGLLIVEV